MSRKTKNGEVLPLLRGTEKLKTQQQKRSTREQRRKDYEK